MNVQIAPNRALRALLERHPRVSSVSVSDGPPLRWTQDGHWHRRIFVGRSDIELKGLVELMDNNPLVCADEMSVPSPASTLALIALGPLARAGLISNIPHLIYSFEIDQGEVECYLDTAGWAGGVEIVCYGLPQVGCRVITHASLVMPESGLDIADLYEEAYGRSFFVRNSPGGVLTPEIVEGRPFAAYRFGSEGPLEPGEVAVSVIADIEGKCGAAQIVHAFNVMAGFEESLGL